MTRISAFSSPLLLGFEEIERALERLSKGAGDGYPPYNIERLARDGDNPERLRITLAVAGFTRDQLDVCIEESQLVIRGRQQDDKSRLYLHRGIAARQFQRTFVLADGMEVLGADLKNGLLSIELQPGVGNAAVERFVDALRLFGRGSSWGGYESLVAWTNMRAARSVTDWSGRGAVVRLHVGLESPRDLTADLASGFEAMASASGA